MRELQEMLERAERLRRAGRPHAVASVVRVDGSAYRRPGARMLIEPGGERCGTISGGCLEGEISAEAERVLEEGRPRLLAYTLSEDELTGFASGCGGNVQVLVEPVTPGDPDGPLRLLADVLARRTPAVLATVIDRDGSDLPLGRRWLFAAGGSTGDPAPPPALAPRLAEDARRAREADRPAIRRYALEEGSVDVLLEVLDPPLRLVLFGDGPDVEPVVRLAHAVGWRVVVVGRDDPETLLRRFPEAEERVFLMHAREATERVVLDPWSAAVVMTHDFPRDRALLPALLRSPARYVGVLGPARRTARLLDRLRDEEGFVPDADMEERLHAPVGLDIGSETPEEIALSMLAEIRAVFSGREGAKLGSRGGPIHEPVPTPP